MRLILSLGVFGSGGGGGGGSGDIEAVESLCIDMYTHFNEYLKKKLCILVVTFRYD